MPTVEQVLEEIEIRDREIKGIYVICIHTNFVFTSVPKLIHDH